MKRCLLAVLSAGLCWLLAIVLSLPCAAQPLLAISSAQVVWVEDGDTLRVRAEAELWTRIIRLSCIDAPELAQPHGKAAAARLAALLPRGTQIQLREIEPDRYGRTVAELYLFSQSINLQLVQEGQAAIFPAYFDRCRLTQTQYRQAQAEAQQQRLGLWQEDKPEMPWQWRNEHRSAEPDKNCSDFATQAQASPYLTPGDPHRLDRNRNGVPCESLPAN